MYKRILRTPKTSFFLFGPRGTGKSTWISQVFPNAAVHINLLKSSEYLKYKTNPETLANEVAAVKKKSVIVIDEIQKIPALLDEVHNLMFEHGKNYQFVLSGSSARKLKRSDANMLAGRALSKKMFTLLSSELDDDFDLEQVLSFGQLPGSFNCENNFDRIEFLDAYVETYLKEEIQQEALVRNLDYFYRFLTVIATVNAQTISISNIARDVGIARSTVQGYFSILEDTLLGWRLPALQKVKVKEVQHPKFYLFDCGVQRALLRQHHDKLSKVEKGHLFETFFINEVRALNSYFNLGGELFYWRTEAGTEVDLIWKRGKKSIAFEIKSTEKWKPSFNKGLQTLLDEKAVNKAYGVYLGPRPMKFGNITVLPFSDALEIFSCGELE